MALHAAGYGYREIARLLGRSPTAVTRAVEAARSEPASKTDQEALAQFTGFAQWVRTGVDHGYFAALKRMKSDPDPDEVDA